MSADIYALARIPIVHRCNGYYVRWYYNGWHYWHFLPGKIEYQTEGEKYRTLGRQRITMGTGQITLGQCAAIRTIQNARELYIFTDAGWWNCIRVEHGSLIVYDHFVNGYEIELTAIIGGRAISITGFSPVAIIPPKLPDALCEVDIPVALQTWMCKAWDAAYPASKVYDDDEDNRAIFGGLYSWNQINSPGFVPAGWHIPTVDEWTALITAIGGALAAGGELKEVGTTHWDSPNTGAVNTYLFALLGYGYYGLLPGLVYGFSGILQIANVWTADEVDANNAYVAQFTYDSAGVSIVSLPKNYYFPVRLIKTTYTPAGPLMDLDGNVYTTVNIGSQQWIVENFKCTKYANGSAIPNITNNALWAADINGAYSWYNNDIVNKADYGALYNYYAVDNGLACLQKDSVQESGWRIPTVSDFDTLSAYLGGDIISGIKLKEAGTTHWDAPNTGATNESGFTALGAGQRYDSGSFEIMGLVGSFWASSLGGDFFTLFNDSTLLANSSADSKYGFSIRLVKDL
jgi:uncharacterized protein (TIGR02145 family)